MSLAATAGALSADRLTRSLHPGGSPAGGLHFVVGAPGSLVGIVFSVMADPVSSVAYAVEAALRALRGDLDLLVPTMGLVVAIIALVIVNYQQLIARYPGGGGAAHQLFLPSGSKTVARRRHAHFSGDDRRCLRRYAPPMRIARYA